MLLSFKLVSFYGCKQYKQQVPAAATLAGVGFCWGIFEVPNSIALYYFPKPTVKSNDHKQGDTWKRDCGIEK